MSMFATPKSGIRNRESEIEVANRQRTVRLDRRRLADLAHRVLRAEKARPAQVEIAVVGDAEMASLNWRHLRHRGPTDVLSFDLSEKGDCFLFQIIVSADAARCQARQRGHAVSAELALYVVHGLLHLLGYDDHEPARRARMHARQRDLLEAAGFRLKG